jgi:hypothetical protein
MSTEYFIIKPAVGTLETGMAYPAVESYDDYDFNATNSVHKLNYREFPDFEPDIRFKLAKGANLTDMLSQAAISAHGFLINEKIKTAFEQFKIVPHKYYPATIEDHEGNIHQYFWLHLVWEDWKNIIDWKNSSFFIRRVSKNLGSIDISSYDDFLSKKKELGVVKMIDFEKVTLKSKIEFDLFTQLKSDVYSTKPLKEYTEHNSFSGVDFSIAEKIRF